MADKLKESISRAKDGTITVRTEEIVKSIGKPEAPLGVVFWFSFVNLFDERIIVRPIGLYLKSREIAI